MSAPAGRKRPHWALVALCCLLGFGYLLAGGGRLHGRLVAAVLGDDWWVQGVAGWLWFAVAAVLLLRAEDGALGAGRRRRAAMALSGAMAVFGLTIVPIGRGAGGGDGAAHIAGAAEAPGFGLGLIAGLVTVPLGLWLLRWDKRERERAERAEVTRAARDAGSFGMPRRGGWILHPDWLRPDDPPVYADAVREHHALPREEYAEHELAFLLKRMREAGRAPAEEPRRRRRRPRPAQVPEPSEDSSPPA